MKIALISDNLGGGGAERQLLLCAAELIKQHHTVKVITYHPQNDYQDFISKNKIDVECIFPPKRSAAGRILKIGSILKRGNFDIVHGFKGSASFYAAASAVIAGRPPVAGGYRVRYVESRKNNVLYKWLDCFS